MKTIENQAVRMTDVYGTEIVVELPLVKNSLNARSFKKRYREVVGPDMTVPDQTMTARELLNRYTSGAFPLLPRDSHEIWEGEKGFGRDPRSYDISEVHTLIERANEVLSHVNETMKAGEQAAKEAARKKAIIDEYEASKPKTDNTGAPESPSKKD